MQSPPGRLTLNPNSLLALVSVRREAVSEVSLMGERGRAPEDILLREVMRDIVAGGDVAERGRDFVQKGNEDSSA